MAKRKRSKKASRTTAKRKRSRSINTSARGRASLTEKASEPRWVKQLRKRKQPLELMIGADGLILPANYDFNSAYECGVVVHHPEGNFDFGQNRPTNRERFGADKPSFRRLSYEKQKARLCESFVDKYGDVPEPLPWSKGQRGLSKWLDQQVEELDCDNELSPWLSEYLVGHPIYAALTPAERKRLGVAQGESGGPGCDGPVVTEVACTMDELNDVIRRKALPFVIVRDERPASMTGGRP